MAAPAPSPLQNYLAVQVVADKEMAAILRDAANEAQRLTQLLAEKAGIGAQVRIAQLNIMRNRLRQMQAELFGEVNKALRDQLKTAAAAAAQGEALMDEVAFNALGFHIPELEAAHLAQASRAVENLYSRAANGIPLSDQVYRTQALSQGYVDRAINRGIALGFSAKEMADSVRKFIHPGTPGGVSYAAMRLGRTELNNAFHRTQIQQNTRKPWVRGMKWNLSGSHPRPDKCNDYADHDNTGFWKVGDIPGKPHPQCLCYLTTVQVSEKEFIDGFIAGDYSEYIDSTIYSSGIPTVC